MKKYPFDTQLCEFGLDLIAKENERFIISGSQEEIISYTGSTDVADFVVVSVCSNITRCFGTENSRIPEDQELVLCIFIKRSHADQLVSIFCPSILFWILAYFTLFLDIDDVSNRSRTTVTLLLVLIALLQTVKKDFPKTTYYKYIDFWFLWYVFNIFLITLYHIILPKIKKNLRQVNVAIKSVEEGQKMQNWQSQQNIDLTRKIEQINTIIIILTPHIMLGFNIVYFILTT